MSEYGSHGDYISEEDSKAYYDWECQLREMGEILSRFKPGTVLSLNCNGNWVVELYDSERGYCVHTDPELAPAGLFKTPLDALRSIDKPVKVSD